MSPIPRGILTMGAMVLLVGVVSLSTVSRAPYHHARTPTWHTSKASRMNESARRGPARRQPAQPPKWVRVETAAVPALLPEVEVRVPLPDPFRTLHFRAPPAFS